MIDKAVMFDPKAPIPSTILHPHKVSLIWEGCRGDSQALGLTTACPLEN